jgi:hypothetical protein
MSRSAAGLRAMAALALATILAVGAAEPPARVGGLTALPPANVGGRNVITNGGFDEGSGTPSGWSLGPAGAWALDPAGHTGPSLRLADADRHGQVVANAEQTVTLEPGLYNVEGWVKSADLGAGDQRSGVRICLDGRPRLNWWKCTDVVRGTTDWKAIRQAQIAVTDRGSYRLTVGAYGIPTGRAWFDDVSLSRVEGPPLDVYLLYPNFRAMLFDDRPQTVRVGVTLRSEGERRATTVRLALLDEPGGGVRVQRQYPATGSFTGELDAASLPAGVYRLRAEALDQSGQAVYAYPDYRIVKVPASARKRFAVWYDERNVAYLGGKPAFVIGLYNTTGYSTSPDAYALGDDGWGDAKIAEAPVNMLINYWLGAAPVEALSAYMDDLHSRGMYYLQTVNFYHRDDPLYAKLTYPAARKGEDELNRWVADMLSRHRGLAGFYTADERPAEMVPRTFRQRQALAEAAPGTVTYAVFGDGWEEQAPLWRDAIDVMGLDPYPITKPRGQNHLPMVGEWTRLGRQAVQDARPVWMVLQFFPLTGAGGWPNEDELRQMSWMAIVDGARGLFYWSFGTRGLAWVKDRAERERHWQDLVRVTREIKTLEPVLLAPDASIVSAESGGGAVRTLGKRMPDGARYLFAYNARNTPVDVTWTLAEPAREVIELGGAAAPTRPDDSRLTTRLAPYEVRRYRLQ